MITIYKFKGQKKIKKKREKVASKGVGMKVFRFFISVFFFQ